MIQFNLLPDVKLAYLKTRRLKRLVSAVSSLIAAVTLVVFIFLLVFVDFIQKDRISSLSTKISKASQQISNTTNLNKILTVQNQLGSLPSLDGAKPVTSRLFGYLSQVTPANVTISSITLSYSANSISISGTADSVATINTFVDTLKVTTYNTGAGSLSNQAFTNVVLGSFSIAAASANIQSSATYNITADFAPALFNVADNIGSLTVPNEITTRSVLDLPESSSPLFQNQPTTGSH